MNRFPKTGTRSGWIFEEEYQFSPRVKLTPGSKIKIRGERGWFTFVSITTNPKINKTWVDTVDKNYQFRSFYLDRIKGVPPKRRNGVVYGSER
jgi:hypothetical protein